MTRRHARSALVAEVAQLRAQLEHVAGQLARETAEASHLARENLTLRKQLDELRAGVRFVGAVALKAVGGLFRGAAEGLAVTKPTPAAPVTKLVLGKGVR